MRRSMPALHLRQTRVNQSVADLPSGFSRRSPTGVINPPTIELKTPLITNPRAQQLFSKLLQRRHKVKYRAQADQ